tara:strand:- start:99 stop:806 length:708 start_codon:yes stop_codon:yes gene_type:complete
MKAEAERKKVFMDVAKSAQQANDVVGQAMSAMEQANKEDTAAYKAMAITQATIAAGLALTKVWADNPNPLYAIPMTAMVAANTGAQIAAIQNANYAQGGYVQGPGTSTSDSISANLSNGEFVMRADAVRKIGLENLERMNLGQMPQFSSGGHVGNYSSPVSGSLGGNSGQQGVNVTFIDQSTGNKELTQEETVDSNGNTNIRLIMRDAVKDIVNKGEIDREMGARYGVKHAGRRT